MNERTFEIPLSEYRELLKIKAVVEVAIHYMNAEPYWGRNFVISILKGEPVCDIEESGQRAEE